MRSLRSIALSLVGVLACSAVSPGNFEAGHLVVVRVGDGRGEVNKGSAVAVFLDEVDPASGLVVRSIPLPTESHKSQRRLTLSLTATSEGQLAVSEDGRYLTLAGYDAPLEMAKVPGSPSDVVRRVVARVDASGRVDTSTALADGYSKNNVRGAVTVDGLKFYLAGAGTGGGSRLVEYGSEGASRLLGSSPNNTRGVVIFEGQLYASVASGEFKGIVAVGRGLPTEEGQVVTRIASSPVAPEPVTAPEPPSRPPDQAVPTVGLDPKPTGFVFLGGKLYVADLESGLLVYKSEGTAEGGFTHYKIAARHALPNLAFLAGRIVDGKPVLFGTDGERLLEITPEGEGFRSVEIARAGAGRAFRGVAFAPTVFDKPILSLPVVVAIGLIGLAIPGATIHVLRQRARRRIRFVGTDILVDGGPIGPA